MFTGLVETVGTLTAREISGGNGRLTVRPGKAMDGLVRGESVAVNGACLTLERFNASEMSFHVLEETLKRTNLGALKIGGKVNLERALSFGGRVGGHLVTGHIDCAARLMNIDRKGADFELTVECPEAIRPFFVEKGSVAIDGISLTVVRVGENFFTVHIIPLTFEESSVSCMKKGTLLNIEADLLGKYVFRQLEARGLVKGAVDMDFLKKAGW